MSRQYLDCLWAQIQKLKKDRWQERHILRPYIAFDSVLCEALQHNLPPFTPPGHMPDAEYPMPRVIFRMFDYTDAPEVSHFSTWLLRSERITTNIKVPNNFFFGFVFVFRSNFANLLYLKRNFIILNSIFLWVGLSYNGPWFQWLWAHSCQCNVTVIGSSSGPLQIHGRQRCALCDRQRRWTAPWLDVLCVCVYSLKIIYNNLIHRS